MAGLLDPESLQNVPILGGLLGSIARGYDPSAAYTGSLARDPQTGKMDPAVEDAFRIRALGAMASAFGEGQAKVPYKGGIPFLQTLGKAAGAAATAGDPLIEARLRAAQSQQALAAAALSQGQYGLLGPLGKAYQAMADDAQKRMGGGGTDASGKPIGPAKYTGVGGGGGGGGGGPVTSTMVYNYALANGASVNEATAITSGMMAESGGNPNQEHDKELLAKRNMPPGYGLFGHNGSELVAMRQYAGVGPNDNVPWQQQVLYSLDSLRDPKSEKTAGDQIRAASNPEALTQAQLNWLRPRDYDKGPGQESWGKRLASTADLMKNPPAWEDPYAAPTQTAAAPTDTPQPPGPGQPTNISTPTPGMAGVPQPLIDTARNAPTGAGPLPPAPAAPAPPGGALAPGAEGNPGPVSGLLGPQQGPQVVSAEPGAGLLSPQGAAILQGIRAAQGGALQGTGNVAGDNAVPTAPPPSPAAARGAAMGQEGADIPSLLAPGSGGPGAPATPPAAPVSAPAPAPPAAAGARPTGPPPVGPPPALPPVSTQMPPLPPFNPPQATPQQQLAMGIAGLSSLVGHPAPEFIQKLANMPTELALEQGKAYINMVTQGMNERDKARIQAIMEPYLAAAKAAAELPYKPERVAPGGGVSLGGQLPTQYAPTLQKFYDPGSQRWYYGYTSPQGAPPAAPGQGWAEPSPAEKAGGEQRGKYSSAGVPGEPVSPDVNPSGVKPGEPLPSPSNQGRSYQTTIPPITQQARTPDFETYGQSQKEWIKENGELADMGRMAGQAEANLNMIKDAYQMVQSGTWATEKEQFKGVMASIANTLGIAPPDTSNLAAIQTALHANYKQTLNMLAAANKRFTGNEFKINSDAGESAGNQPDANMKLLSADMGQVRQLRSLSDDWNHAQTYAATDGSRWVNPFSFETAWLRQNKIEDFIKGAEKDIGQLKGTVPGDLPKGTTYGGTDPRSGQPYYILPDGKTQVTR